MEFLDIWRMMGLFGLERWRNWEGSLGDGEEGDLFGEREGLEGLLDLEI